jgi:hypothetical protein
MKKIKLDDIVDAIDLQHDEGHSVLHLKTGEIYMLTNDILDSDHYNDAPEWQQELIQQANYYEENPDEFIDLPNSREIDEYSLMEDFAREQNDENISDALLGVISGKGAFRRFKDKIINFDLRESWYAHRRTGYRQFIRQWCEDAGIAIEE